MRTASSPPSSASVRLLPALLLTSLLAVTSVLMDAVAPAAADRREPPAGVWPLHPRPTVVAGFDPPSTRWGAGHRGVDLAGRAGEPVLAAAAGRVSFAGRLAGRGVVVVDHGATRTTYEPVSAAVSVGDRVVAGETLGRLEVFGSHCFPRSCLHWGLIEGRDHYLDPLTLVGAGPVRLLPLDGGLPVPGRATRPAPGLLPLLPLLPAGTSGPRGTAAMRRDGPAW